MLLLLLLMLLLLIIAYPCLCLCFAVLQITLTIPLRLMILQSSHIFFTEERTFMIKSFFVLLAASRYWQSRYQPLYKH